MEGEKERRRGEEERWDMGHGRSAGGGCGLVCRVGMVVTVPGRFSGTSYGFGYKLTGKRRVEAAIGASEILCPHMRAQSCRWVLVTSK
jgi:hypothetical protein